MKQKEYTDPIQKNKKKTKNNTIIIKATATVQTTESDHRTNLFSQKIKRSGSIAKRNTYIEKKRSTNRRKGRAYPSGAQRPRSLDE